MGTRDSFPGVKFLGHESDHSSPSSAEVKIRGAIPPLPSTSSWHGSYKHRDNFTFTISLPYQPHISGLVQGEEVLQQQHPFNWAWNGSCDKYVEGVITAGLFSLFSGYEVHIIH